MVLERVENEDLRRKANRRRGFDGDESRKEGG